MHMRDVMTQKPNHNVLVLCTWNTSPSTMAINSHHFITSGDYEFDVDKLVNY